MLNHQKAKQNTLTHINNLIQALKNIDGKDIAAVKTENEEYGHVLFSEDKNRSKDKNPHRGESFISNEELRKKIKNSFSNKVF